MNLYNLRSASPGYRINKFDMDANFITSYNVSNDTRTCTCPASLRPTCKHRKMIYKMKDHIDDGWFLCWETQKWHRPIEEVTGEDEAAPNRPDAVVEDTEAKAITLESRPFFECPHCGGDIADGQCTCNEPAPTRPLVTRR